MGAPLRYDKNGTLPRVTKLLREAVRLLGDTIWQHDCPACGRVGPDVLCVRCRRSLHLVPRVVAPPINPAVPVIAAGEYGGTLRALIVTSKADLRSSAMRALGNILAAVIQRQIALGVVLNPRIEPLILIPAPSTRRARRDRGGDLVTRYCRYAAQLLGPGVIVAPLVELADTTGDQVGRSLLQRRGNLSGHVRIRQGNHARALGTDGRWRRVPQLPSSASIFVVDDVVTTGSTLSETVMTLRAAGVVVRGAFVVSAA